VGIGLFAANVEQAVLREARGLHGGDIEIRLSQRLSEAGRHVLHSLGTRGVETSHASELVAMAVAVRTAHRDASPDTQLVELKAVEDNYPLYGKLTLEPATPLSKLLTPPLSSCQGPSESRSLAPHGVCYGAVVQESLLIRMGLSVGQSVKIGQAWFRITGIVRKEPDRMANMFSLGPRVLISQQGLAAAELVKPGSRVRERYLLKVPSALPLDPLLYELRGRLAPDATRVSSFRETQPQLKQFLEQLSRYLGLIGLTALFVGGIGIAMSIQAFLRAKVEHVAVLKTLGAESGLIILLYLTQTLGLATVGAVGGVGIGVMLQGLLPRALAGLLDTNFLEQVEFSSALTAAALVPIAKGFALGVLTTLLFTLWPLLQIRDMRPASIFRREVLPTGQEVAGPLPWSGLRAHVQLCLRRDNLTTILVIGGGLFVLSLWQAASWQLGVVFMGGLALAVLLLLATARGVLSALPSLPISRSVSLRHALGNITRPGSHATGVIMALGIGVMVILTVALLERSLVEQLGESRPSDAPTFFFIDIQPDQAKGFASLLHKQTGNFAPALTPLVRSRLHALNGQPITAGEESENERGGHEERRKVWYLTREYVLTFLDHLPKDNTLVKGAWWPQDSSPGKPLVSVEEEAAKNLGLDVGATVTLDIQGAKITAEVSSIRNVAWGNFSTNFYMILSPGSLEGAPFTYVATVNVPPQKEVPLQQAVVAAFPNVTAINIGDVLESFTRVLDRLSLAIRGVALFCVIAAGLVMGAALAVTRYRRLYESVILKALGATRGFVAKAFAIEYLLLGTVAGMIGITLSSGLGWAILRFVFDLPWMFQPGLLACGMISTVVLTVLIGFGGTFGILGKRPLPILRRE
jgi:putative ABC transport system permease protein